MSQPIEFKIKRGTSSALAALNPLLAAGEPCLETDTNKIKYGNGVDTWNNLSYANADITTIDGNDPAPLPSGTPGVFSPASISGLSLWLESTDSDSASVSNSRLSAWINKKDNTYLTQTRFSLRPTVVDFIKNKSVPSFDGENDKIFGSTELGEDITAFVVINTKDDSSNSSVLATDSLQLCSFNSDGKIGTRIGSTHYSGEAADVDAELVLNFNEDIIDSSKNNQTITTYGNVELANGKFGKSVYLDGSSYIQAPAQALGSDDFTIEFWAKPETDPATAWTILLTMGEASANELRIGQNINNNGTGFYIPNNSKNAGRAFSSGRSLSLNAWSHIALVRTGSVLRYYLNGLLVATASNVTWSWNHTGPLRIGYGFYSWDGYYKGYIDGLRIIKKAIYSGEYFSLPTTEPSAHYSENVFNKEPILYSCELSNRTNLTTKINGITSYSGPVSAFNDSSRIAIGSDIDGNNVFNGDIAAVIVYNKTLTSLEYNQIKSYLHLRWVNEEGLKNKLLGYWNCNEIDGPRADLSDYSKILAVGEAAGYSQNVLSSSTSGTSLSVNNNTVTPLPGQFTKIAYGNGIYLGINNTTTSSSYITSPDGITWTTRTLPVNAKWNDIKYINNLFVIVGDSSTGLTSTDGVTWNQVTLQNTSPSSVNAALLLNFNGTNNATSTTDSSPNNYAITMHNGAKLSNTQSKFGGTSLQLTRSSSQYVSIANTALTSPLISSSFTMECWFRATSDGGTSCLMTTRHDGNGLIACIGASKAYADSWRSPTIWCGIHGFNWRSSIIGPAVTLNTWYHVAMTVDASSGVMKLYVNGSLVGTSTNAYLNDNRPMYNLYIGRRWDNYDFSNQYFDGFIEDAKITYGIAYNANFTPPTTEAVVSTNNYPPIQSWKSIAYGNNKYVAISNAAFSTSTDGVNWTNTANFNSKTISTLQKNGTTITVTTSTNHNFNTGDIVNIVASTAGTYSFVNGGFPIVVTGSNTFTYNVSTTNTFNGVVASSGSVFSSLLIPNHSWTYIDYVNNTFLVLTNNAALRSSDGASWSYASSSWVSQADMAEAVHESIMQVLIANNKWIVKSYKGNGWGITSSVDGKNWVREISMSNSAAQKIAFTDNKYIMRIDSKTVSISSDIVGLTNVKNYLSVLDDNTDIYDMIANNNHILSFGSQANAPNGYVATNFDIATTPVNTTSVLFDGLGYLETDITNAAESFTVWVKIPTLNTTNRSNTEILGQWDGGAGSWRLLYDHNNGGLVVDIGENRLSPGIAGAGVASNLWNFVAGTYENNIYKLYVFLGLGSEYIVSEPILLTGLLNGYNLRVGSLSLNPASSFIGEIDNLGLWDRPLTEAEIRQLYKQGIASHTL